VPVTTIDYRIKQTDGKYGFILRLSQDSTTSANRWRLRDIGPLVPLAISKMTGGEWDYWRPNPPQRGNSGTISLYDGATQMLDFYLDNVPKDYVHGVFCSITSGPAGYKQGTDDVYDLVWTVFGPGCT
jgi:hypothetical protein